MDPLRLDATHLEVAHLEVAHLEVALGVAPGRLTPPSSR
jgi:hypothetical protein